VPCAPRRSSAIPVTSGSGDVSALADLNASTEVLREIRLVPVDKPAVMQMLAAIGLPLLGVIATQVPLVELVRWLAGTLI